MIQFGFEGLSIFNRYADGLFAQRHEYLRNKGTHQIHTGGRYDSHLLIPIIPQS